MDLTINNTVFSNDSAEVCDSIEWNGNVYTTSGIYVDTLQTISGCDSIITMDLTINNSQYDTIIVSSVIAIIGMVFIITILGFTRIIIFLI